MNIYIGYDPREEDAYNVAQFSIESRTSEPVSITQLKLNSPPVSDHFKRPLEWKDGRMWCPISEAYAATEFAVSRFLVPFIQKEGWALFMDCDMLATDDIKNLFDCADDKYAVMVVKHKPFNSGAVKMDGQIQSYYNRKNWSSVVLWNCGHPANKRLTLENVNTWPGRDLHAFNWLKDEEIGELDKRWNHLVGVDEPNAGNTGICHYTLGGAWFDGWGTKYPEDALWQKEYEKMKEKT
jgi:lipopolysaccharide biosynthesis glycosyltransferase